MDSVIEQKHVATSLLASFAALFRKYAMYPPGHPSVDAALNRLNDTFNHYFKMQPAISIGIGQDKVFLGDQEISGDERIGVLSQALHQHGVSQVSFRRGMTRKHLEIFLDAMRLEPLVARDMGGYKQILAERGVNCIDILEIDYKFQDDVIAHTMDTLSDIEVWKKLAIGWTDGLNETDPEYLAFMKQMLDAPRLAMILDTALDGSDEDDDTDAEDIFFQMVESLKPEYQAEGTETFNAFKTQIKHVLEDVSNRNRFVLFRKAARDYSGNSPDRPLVADLLHEISDRPMARGLFEGLDPELATMEEFAYSYANYATPKKEHGLLTEITNLVKDKDLEHDKEFPVMLDRASKIREDEAPLQRLKEQLGKIHDRREILEIPVYRFLREQLKVSEEILDEMDDTKIAYASVIDILRVLDMVQHTESYRFYAEGLADVIQDLIHTGQYDLAEKAVRMLRKHASKKNPHPISKKVARVLLMELRKPELAEDILNALSQWGKKQSAALGGLLMGLGPAAYDPLLKALSREKNRTTRAVMLDVLNKAGPKLAPAVKEYLGHSNWFVVRNMIALYAKLQPEDLVENMKVISKNPEPRVRLEIARILSLTDDTDAVPLLIEMTQDENEDVRRQAVLSLGHFKGSSSAIRTLVVALSKKKPFHGDEKAEFLAVRALGMLHTNLSIPVLTKYIEKPGLLGGYDSKLVSTAANALASLDDPKACEALRKGCKSWNRTVRRLCEECLVKSESERL